MTTAIVRRPVQSGRRLHRVVNCFSATRTIAADLRWNQFILWIGARDLWLLQAQRLFCSARRRRSENNSTAQGPVAAWRNVLPFPLGKWSWGGSCDDIYRAVLAMRRKPLLRLRNFAGAAGCGHVPKRVKVKNVPIRTVSSPRKSNIHFVVVFFLSFFRPK